MDETSIDLIFFTSNKMKEKEVKEFFEGSRIKIETRFIDYPEIQAGSVEEVIRSSIAHLQDQGFDNFMIDDTGLEILACSNFPGVYSKYILWTIGRDGLLRLMKDITDRRVRVYTCVGLSLNRKIHVFQGTLETTLSNEDRTPEKKSKIFRGFDGIICLPNDSSRTLIDLTYDQKNRISHRGRCLEKVRSFLLTSAL